MVSAEQLSNILFFEGISPSVLESLAEKAERRSLSAGDFLVRHHDEALSVFLLISGRLRVFLHFEGVDRLFVGTILRPGVLIGWSAFRAPYRYTSTIQCEEPCELIQIPRSAFESLFEKDPALSYEILQRVCKVVTERLEQAKKLLMLPRKKM